uniref:CBS domain-containing protein n=1 Tax=Biomphalaria glabrata TaxID=6526 RepID=A0A2C9KWN1_BIOGL
MLHFVLSYPEKSAGRLIQKDVIAVPYTWDVAKSIEFLENHHVITEELVQVFVVDEEGCPVGFVPIAKLFFSDKRTNIVAIMNKNIKIIRPDMDQEEVVHIFRKYALISAPVVDENGTMIGYIAADDIAEVMGTEIERDILNLGGILENDIYSTVLRTVRSRFPWLFINIAMATITSSVIGFFDDTIGKM